MPAVTFDTPSEQFSVAGEHRATVMRCGERFDGDGLARVPRRGRADVTEFDSERHRRDPDGGAWGDFLLSEVGHRDACRVGRTIDELEERNAEVWFDVDHDRIELVVLRCRHVHRLADMGVVQDGDEDPRFAHRCRDRGNDRRNGWYGSLDEERNAGCLWDVRGGGWVSRDGDDHHSDRGDEARRDGKRGKSSRRRSVDRPRLDDVMTPGVLARMEPVPFVGWKRGVEQMFTDFLLVTRHVREATQATR